MEGVTVGLLDGDNEGLVVGATDNVGLTEGEREEDGA